MPELNELSDEDVLTACYLWAEAGGEPEHGQQAVRNVMLNRSLKRIEPSIRDVIL